MTFNYDEERLKKLLKIITCRQQKLVISIFVKNEDINSFEDVMKIGYQATLTDIVGFAAQYNCESSNGA